MRLKHTTGGHLAPALAFGVLAAILHSTGLLFVQFGDATKLEHFGVCQKSSYFAYDALALSSRLSDPTTRFDDLRSRNLIKLFY